MRAVLAAVVRAVPFVVVAGLLGCHGHTPPSTFARNDEDRGRFPHIIHRKLAIPCTDCHAMSGKSSRPGAADHAPCDNGRCHRAEFLAPPGPLCKVCHARVNPRRAGDSPLRPYPPQSGTRKMASAMSHALHLDRGRMEDAVGFHVDCRDCHAIGGSARASLPGHKACARCHAGASATAKIPAMTACSLCHRVRAEPPARARQTIAGDLHFDHRNHVSDRQGKIISCRECHQRADEVTETGAHQPPTAEACVSCHDDENRVPPDKRMSACQTCHATRQAGLGALAPRSHLTALARPADHTLAFRRDHGDEARRDSHRCAGCHSFMSGSPRDTCDECHQVMRPRDHTVAWREFDHGPAAVADSDRCQTCHDAEMCVTCHSQPPRSHFPLGAFRAGGHGFGARFNLRACLACHTPDRDCTTAGCHTVVP